MSGDIQNVIDCQDKSECLPFVQSSQLSDIDSSNVTCPFCQESDFDLVGLKKHLLNGWCDKFGQTP